LSKEKAQMTSKWRVYKFGGTSLKDASMFQRVADILQAESNRPLAVIVSAMAGVTDALMEMGQLAQEGEGQYLEALKTMQGRHQEVAAQLLENEALENFDAFLLKQVRDIADLLRAVSLAHHFSEASADLISGYGELLSAQLLTCYLKNSGQSTAFCDAREVLCITHQEVGPVPLWEQSQARLKQWREERHEDIWVVTGYIASDKKGAPTTLKRNGSDYSASIFAALLGARDVTIWTDVDGVYSADPRLVVQPLIQEKLSYKEAMELAYFGAKVIHPNTMAPLVERAIPIWIRNTNNPSYPGTQIHSRHPDDHAVVKGLASVQGLALINVEGSGMIGVPGIASRLFGGLQEARISVVMISQASSEHSICFAVPNVQAERAQKAVEQVFTYELTHGKIQTVEVHANCSIIAAVGDLMAHRTGVAAQFFRALGQARINICAIAQGSSERNITAVIDGDQTARAIQSLHAGFYLSDQTLAMGVVGPGLIGKTFIEQLKSQKEKLLEDFKIDLRIMGIANSKKMIHDKKGINLDHWEADLKEGVPVDLNEFAEAIRSDGLPHSVIVDCTASDFVAKYYEPWLSSGTHVITPNKKANSGDLQHHEKLMALKKDKHTHYFYEATVGAGLPVISSLRELKRTGDQIFHVEGVLSGTMSYLFNTFDGSIPFSEVVKGARERGYTEPHPKDDLMGLDVARKLVILAREMGHALSLEDVSVEAVMPEGLDQEDDVDEFLVKLSQMDEKMQHMLESAQAKNKKLCYLGKITDDQKAEVKLVSVDPSHPFSGLSGSDNMIAFTTERYCDQPLVIRGPGAGPQVTAGGVFADVLRLAAHLGARS
jgi:bifunctional aspartokinase / homoserine dehydrogenase 1